MSLPGSAEIVEEATRRYLHEPEFHARAWLAFQIVSADPDLDETDPRLVAAITLVIADKDIDEIIGSPEDEATLLQRVAMMGTPKL